jgi:hypothetical protein
MAVRPWLVKNNLVDPLPAGSDGETMELAKIEAPLAAVTPILMNSRRRIVTGRSIAIHPQASKEQRLAPAYRLYTGSMSAVCGHRADVGQVFAGYPGGVRLVG